MLSCAPLGSRQAILEFGCGCGCVLRRWRGLDARVWGTDYSGRVIQWCHANLPFAEVRVKALEPPLDHGDASFDVVYALSVFTYLPVETQLAWRDELRGCCVRAATCYFRSTGTRTSGT
jgi:predicted TPR repeat methyltransferase